MIVDMSHVRGKAAGPSLGGGLHAGYCSTFTFYHCVRLRTRTLRPVRLSNCHRRCRNTVVDEREASASWCGRGVDVCELFAGECEREANHVTVDLWSGNRYSN